MTKVVLIIVACLMTGCGAGTNVQPDQMAPAMQTQWCTFDPVTKLPTAGNACPK